jgi:DNA mismatch repair ATPase MutS
VAAADLSTGEFRLARARPGAELDAVLARFAPREVLVARGSAGVGPRVDEALVTEREAWEFDPSLAGEDLRRHFGVLACSGSRASGSAPTTTRRWAPRARCCATCASCSRPACRSSRRRAPRGPARRCRSTR